MNWIHKVLQLMLLVVNNVLYNTVNNTVNNVVHAVFSTSSFIFLLSMECHYHKSLKPTQDLSRPILDNIDVHSKSFQKLYET